MRKKKNWKELTERYFRAETSEQEELRLREYLVKHAGECEEYDEALALMGLCSMARKDKSTNNLMPLHWLVSVAVAACVILAMILMPRTEDQYRVMMNGHEVESTLATALMENQMTEIFDLE